MKIAKSELVAPGALHVGDQITVSITHQINIDGSDAWVKYEAVSKVREGEDVAMADQRVIDHATHQVIVVAAQAAAAVEQYTNR